MKKRELQSLATKTKEELKKLADEKELELLKVVANLKASKEKNLKKAKNVKRDLAQVMTKLREKEIIQEEEQGKGGESSS